jgi:hypothetical protein
MTLRFRATRIHSAALSSVVALSAVGCSLEVPEDQACIELRDAGLSASKSDFAREWISRSLADPASLANVGKSDGPLWAGDVQADPVWEMLGIPRGKGMVEFYGAGIDYRNMEPSAVGAVIIGNGYGYKLIFKMRADTDIEARLKEESKKPYSAIRMQTLSPDLVLVCQVNLY